MDSFRLEVPITVRFRDIDSMGHVNNAVYFTFCEIARNAYWTRLFGIRGPARTSFIIARAEIDYRSQANEGDDVRVGIRVASIGTTSFDFQYRIFEGTTGRVMADGRSVQVTFDYKTNRKIPLSDDVKERILEFEGSENVEIRGKSASG